MTNTIDRMEFESAIESLGYEDIRENYSGRGMYGSTCIGVVLPGRAVMQVSGALHKYAAKVREQIEDLDYTSEADHKFADECEELAEALENMSESISTDNMGLDVIVYWPGWEFSS